MNKGAERFVALKELWRDVGKFVDGDGYKKVEMRLFEVEIV